jgi:hypothetical protein
MDKITWKPNLDEVVERYMALWEGKLNDQVVVLMEPDPAMMGAHESWEYKFEYDFLKVCPDIPAMFAANERLLKLHSQINDDFIPTAWVTYGSAAGGAFWGADMEFYPASGGYSPPLIKSWDQLDDLKFDPEWKWNQELRKACEYFAEHANGRFGVAMMETLADLNIVHNLRGFQFLYDIYDHRQEVERLMEMSIEFNIQWIDMVREALGEANTYRGGRLDFWGMWQPGDTIFASVDAYNLCDPKILEWGRPYIQRLVDHYGSGWIHHHAIGLRLLPEALKINNILFHEFCDDPGQPKVFPRMREIKDLTGDIPIMIDVDFELFVPALREHRLKGGAIYWVRGAPSIEQANEVMKEVRRYRT